MPVWVRINAKHKFEMFVDAMFTYEFDGFFVTGKTCLVRRFTQGVFPPGQGATIGVDFMIKTVVVDNEKIKVSFVHFQSIFIRKQTIVE